ncbi:MAG TPA: hypothetical protein VLT36_24440, partial [Candidatus Dormibacteraeota bacterium]|nr:hypothetical protein [Candidatus Dormibacteraeota bacterium]
MKRTLLSLVCLLAITGCETPGRSKPHSSTDVVLEDFKLVGELHGDQAAFTLTATARVSNSKGASLDLLQGTLALTEVGPHPKWNVRAEPNKFVLEFERDGKFPIQLKFNSVVHEHDSWKSVDFRVAPSAVAPLVLRGLDADTKFDFPGAARPDRKGNEFVSYLPADGAVKLSWKQARTETEGKLFYSGEMLSQISVSPGLMRQVALFDFKVMQGELTRIALLLHGDGEVTRVQGEQVLAWNVEPGTNSADRRLVIQFNQPQKDHFGLQIQAQTPLGAFPQSADVLQLRPENATRFAGYFRIVNDGAVRLEITQATGLSQISPDQFPETDVSKTALHLTGTQKFAYRFSGAGFALRINADQVLPELGVSQVLAYRLGENEQTIDADIELEIREAPLRELLLRVPKGYAIARLNASGLSDYFLREPEDQTDAELRLVYGQPLSGRQLVQLRLERNKSLGEALWTLPRIEVAKAKSTRGHVGVAADAGFRLTAERTQGLTEIATAFFPQKLAGIQSAFRLSEPAWQASVRVERMPQTVQADVLHLFSIGEGIAYGSSLLNYVISGAPVAEFKVELSDEYFNVEFTGKDIRSRQKIEGGYLVQLHTPVSGPYTLLATYERPFKAQGDTLAFTGAHPLDAQSEQGHTIIISANQFRVEAADVSSGLLPLEPGEVPAEYRLFFDAPILRAYRYTARPFNLKLALSPLAQGDSLNQVVDRATLSTRISKEGQVLTDVRYFVKSRGKPHFRLTLPAGLELWTATVNGSPVVPVTDAQANLIPLPQRGDPNAIQTVEVKLASRSTDAKHVRVAAPIVDAPVMLAEWKVQPDTKQRLVYSTGSLTPAGGVPDASGFAALANAFIGAESGRAVQTLLTALVLFGAAVVLWRWAAQPGLTRLSPRHWLGAVLGFAAFVFGIVGLSTLGSIVQSQKPVLPSDLTFLAPIQQASRPLSLEVLNVPDKILVLDVLSHGWPVLLAIVAFLFAWITEAGPVRTLAGVLGWCLFAWVALRFPNGVPAFLVIVAAFLLIQVAIPALRRLWQVTAETVTTGEAPHAGAAPAVTGWLIGALLCIGGSAFAKEPLASSPAPHSTHLTNSPIAETVSTEIRIEEKFALGKAFIYWKAEKDETLPLLFEPAVLTRILFPSNSLELLQPTPGQANPSQRLVALKSGAYDIEIRYELHVTKQNEENGFTLPVQFGLINRLNLTVVNNDVDVQSAQAVSVQRELAGSNTVANLVLSPGANVWVGWKPRTRDVKHEKPVFYA